MLKYSQIFVYKMALNKKYGKISNLCIRNQIKIKQGVAITGRNTTGPPWSVGRSTGSVTDDDRRQQAKQYWPIRRAGSNTSE